jgi:hypothetical protein
MIAMCRVKPEATTITGIRPPVKGEPDSGKSRSWRLYQTFNMLQFLWFFLFLWRYHKKTQVKWVFPSLETCLSICVVGEKVSIPKHPLPPNSRGKNMLDKMPSNHMKYKLEQVFSMYSIFSSLKSRCTHTHHLGLYGCFLHQKQCTSCLFVTFISMKFWLV